MRFFFPDTPPLPLPPGHRFPASKYQQLVAKVRAENLLGAGRLTPSPLISRGDLEAVHDAGYIDAFLRNGLNKDDQRRIGVPWSEILKERALGTVGGTAAATIASVEDGVSGQLAGGTHHAHYDFGSGFCVFNDIAVSIHRARASGAANRFAILDLDVHQGDGNAAMMAGDQDLDTHVISVHGAKNFPFRKVASDLDIPLADATDDAGYLDAVDAAIQSAQGFSPDLVFFISGVDPLISDRLGRLNVSANGLAERDHRVLSWTKQQEIPCVIIIGGGYADPVVDTVNAYAQTFIEARKVYGWR